MPTPPLPDPDPPRATDLLVVGAGVMGAWTAFWARRSGRAVTLLDAYGVGHGRATSGDETRITRAAHGTDGLYTRWSRRSLEHWRRFGDEWGEELVIPCGVLWFARHDDGFEAKTIPVFDAQEVPYERLEPAAVQARWPQVRTDDLRFALYEPEGGALRARRGCQAVVGAFRREGGAYGQAAVQPGRAGGGRLIEVGDRNGRAWSADTFVFACGPWLPALFPDVLGDVIRVTKQDVVFLGPPAGDGRFHADAFPAWCDYDAAYWGIPATHEHGFKVGPDRYGPIFDPSNGERVVDPESVRLARAYVRRRFPALANSPAVETRVCQYETTPDAHFLIARHPEWHNVWLVGGGSGHGFKHGPRIGEYLAARLAGTPEGEQEGPDEARFRIGPRSAASGARTAGDEMARTWEIW